MKHFETLTLNELNSAYIWGRDCLDCYKANGEEVPAFMYERFVELAADFARKLFA